MASVGGKTIYLHRLIMKAPKGVTVDHINRDGLDNRKANLRLASQSENNANREVRNSTGFRGVVKHRSKFRAFISAPRTEARAHFHLGCFSTAEEAARAYDKAARARWGAFAQLNFPQEAQQ
ncbi:MAG: HNH endonuclease [Alphaproteobacteria bacterium]|nr:HNH endonuclease [Alphaproteobacteria bacterium]